MTEWIDFKALRKGLSFEQVLAYYDVAVKPRGPGNRHVGFCPLPNHKGKKRSPSFSAKLDWGVWQCFGCKARGNVLDFAVLMEGLDPRNTKDLRHVALKLQAHFQVPEAGIKPTGQPKPANNEPAKPRSSSPSPPPPTSSPPPHPRKEKVLVNPPLDFELKDLDPDHPYLTNRGFTGETVQHFGLGYCNRGLMKGRIAIPLHDPGGKLIGYAGRLVDDAAVGPDTPKYLLPGPRERDGTTHEFRKSLFLYGGWRVQRPVQDLVVVEGFASVWWLWQWGYPAAVALMGSDCADEQARLIASLVTATGCVWALPDAGSGGEACAASVLTRVSRHRPVRWVRLSTGQPTDCTPGDLAKLLWPA